jgi:hypothetical protein
MKAPNKTQSSLFQNVLLLEISGKCPGSFRASQLWVPFTGSFRFVFIRITIIYCHLTYRKDPEVFNAQCSSKYSMHRAFFTAFVNTSQTAPVNQLYVSFQTKQKCNKQSILTQVFRRAFFLLFFTAFAVSSSALENSKYKRTLMFYTNYYRHEK